MENQEETFPVGTKIKTLLTIAAFVALVAGVMYFNRSKPNGYGDPYALDPTERSPTSR